MQYLFILDPCACSTIGWDHKGITAHFGIMIKDSVQDWVFRCGQFRSHLLYLESINVCMDKVGIMIGIDQNVFKCFTGLDMKIYLSWIEEFAIEIILRKGDLVKISTHEKNDSF